MKNEKNIMNLVTLLVLVLLLVGCDSEKTTVIESEVTEPIIAATEEAEDEVLVEEAEAAEAEVEEIDIELVEAVSSETVEAVSTESDIIGIGSTIVFSEMEITFNSAELYEKDAYNSYVVVSVHLNNLKSVQNYIGGSQMTVTNEAGEPIMLELFDVEGYNNIVKAKPMAGETAEAFILITTKELGAYKIVFDDPYKEDDEVVTVNIEL